MPRCLVTGASGFLGSRLIDSLRKAQWEVRALVRHPQQGALLRNFDVELVVGRLDEPAPLVAAARGVDVIFHVAGRTKATSSHQFHQDNVEGTRHVLQAARQQPSPPLILFVSSLAAGGPSALGRSRCETDQPSPISAYGRSKLAAEQMLSEAASDVPVSIVRPPVIFGPADRASLAIYRSLRFLPIHLAPGWRQLPLSIVFVADLCAAMLQIAALGERVPAQTIPNSGDAQGIYHVAGERSITYGEMGQLAATAAGWAVAVVPLPRLFFWGVGAVGECVGRLRRQPAMINWDKVREATASGWVCDDAKIRRQLGYAPSASLETQFAETVAWYRAEGWI